MLPGRACGTERLCVFRIREAAIAAESSLSLDGGVEEAAKAVEVCVVGWGEWGEGRIQASKMQFFFFCFSC